MISKLGNQAASASQIAARSGAAITRSSRPTTRRRTGRISAARDTTPIETSTTSAVWIVSRWGAGIAPAGRTASAMAIPRMLVTASDTIAARKNGAGPESTSRKTRSSILGVRSADLVSTAEGSLASFIEDFPRIRHPGMRPPG